LKKLVEVVAKKEGIKLEPSSADLLALLGDGSFRDTLGILQKVIISSPDKKISHEEVEAIVGAPQNRLVNDIISAIAERDIAKGLFALMVAEKEAGDMKVLLDLVLRKMRFVLLLRFAPMMRAQIKEDVAEEDYAFLERLAKEAVKTLSSREIAELLDVYHNLRTAAISTLPLELALMRIVGHTTEVKSSFS
jgi:DNA polymerase-3 subunit gamma/tau